jgi:hypothetical protein
MGLRIVLVLLLCLATARSDVPTGMALTAKSAPEPLLPLKIPGYDLRVLDVGKPVVLFAAGTRLEASLPVFFYLPNSDQTRATELVQKAYERIQTLSRKPEWTADELQQVMIDLDHALQIFRSTADSTQFSAHRLPSPMP